MRTVQEILYDARTLVDEYNENGVIISDDEITTLETNAIRFVDMAQKEMFRHLKNYSFFEFSNKRIPNLLGSQFQIVQHIGEDQTYPQSGEGVVGAKAYFFTLDSTATVLIREYDGATWSTLTTLNLTPTEKTDYSGLITPSDPNYPIEIVFSGANFYNHSNRCLYSYPFLSTAIPQYKEYIKIEMPSDYGELVKVIEEYPTYNKEANFKWQGFNDIYIKQEYEGSIKIIYNPIPTTVIALTDELTINNLTAEQAIIYYVASRLANTENTDLINLYEGKFNELKFEANKKRPMEEEKIQDVYFESEYKDYTNYNRWWY